jgi:uncharacterized protein YgiM (DUF1202 family)
MKRSVARRMLLYPSMLLGITAMVLTQSFVVMATETLAVQETETVTETGTTNTVDVQNTANETDSGTGAGTEAESDTDSDPAPTIAEQGLILETGVASVIDVKVEVTHDTVDEIVRSMTSVSEEDEEEEEEVDFVMAKVENSVNVRQEPDADSECVGKLYQGCGGILTYRGDEWSRIKSGNLEGYVSNEYLCFDEEAIEYAKKLGCNTAIVNTMTLRVRKEPSEDAQVAGLLEIGSEYPVVEELDGWVGIKYEKKECYVASQYVDVELIYEEGETIEEIKERERLASLAKAQLVTSYSSVSCTESEVELLACIIQCEAGNQGYEGRLAVGAVICNRVRSSKFPNTITDVVYSPGQFGPVSNGQLADRLAIGASSSCRQAAEDALNGAINVGDAKYFKRAGNKTGVVIGAHVFY